MEEGGWDALVMRQCVAGVYVFRTRIRKNSRRFSALLNFAEMGETDQWIEVIAGVRSLYDLIRGQSDYFQILRMHRKLVRPQAERAQDMYPQYTQCDLEDLAKKVDACRELMLHFGRARDRYPWLCAMLREIADVNDGRLPQVDEWPMIFDRLGCGCMEKDNELMDPRQQKA